MKKRDWKKVKLGEVVEITNGYAFKSSKYVTSNGARVIRITNVQRGEIVDNDPKLYPFADVSKLDKYELFEDDILMSLTGNVGRVGLFPKELLPAYLNQRVCRITPIKNVLDNRFLYYFFNNGYFEHLARHNSGGVAQLNLSTKWVTSLSIPLPPISEQKAIAAQLDRADKVRQALAQSLADYDRLLAASFLDMFGDPVLNPKGWELVKLGELIKKVKKISSDYSSDTIEYVDISSIDNTRQIVSSVSIFDIGERPSRAQQILKKGDILFSTVRPNLRNIALSPRDNLIGSTGFFISRVKSDRIKNQYLFSLLKSTSVTTYFVNQTTGANYPALKSSDLKNFPIPLPPLPLQQQFAQLVERIERQKALIQSAQQSAEDLFGALLQAYFYEGK